MQTMPKEKGIILIVVTRKSAVSWDVNFWILTSISVGHLTGIFHLFAAITSLLHTRIWLGCPICFRCGSLIIITQLIISIIVFNGLFLIHILANSAFELVLVWLKRITFQISWNLTFQTLHAFSRFTVSLIATATHLSVTAAFDCWTQLFFGQSWLLFSSARLGNRVLLSSLFRPLLLSFLFLPSSSLSASLYIALKIFWLLFCKKIFDCLLKAPEEQMLFPWEVY